MTSSGRHPGQFGPETGRMNLKCIEMRFMILTAISYDSVMMV